MYSVDETDRLTHFKASSGFDIAGLLGARGASEIIPRTIIFISGPAYRFYYVSVLGLPEIKPTIKNPYIPSSMHHLGRADSRSLPEAKCNVPFLSQLTVEVSVQSRVTARTAVYQLCH